MCRFSMLIPILAGRRAFSQSTTRQSYENTIQNLLVHKDTKVLCQGFTGKTVRAPVPLETRRCPQSHISILRARTGNFPCKGSIGVRDQDGRRCFSKEGRSDTSRSAGIRIGERGIERPPFRFKSNMVSHISPFFFWFSSNYLRPFAKLSRTRRCCTCHRRALLMPSSRRLRTRLA